jgi:hypothetical protein
MNRLLGYWDLVCFWTGCFGFLHMWTTKDWLDRHPEWFARHTTRVCIRCGAERSE